MFHTALSAILETYVSLTFHVPFILFFGSTLTLIVLDKFIFNGIINDYIVDKNNKGGYKERIGVHEAGHFLVCYLLGCPVEGVVLSSLEAMRDVRFGGLTTSVSAGTSFFDETFNREIEQGSITKGTVDRYSIIVMAGIASEGMCYERAEGGASDEEALVQFLRSINPEKGGAREFDMERWVWAKARQEMGGGASTTFFLRR